VSHDAPHWQLQLVIIAKRAVWLRSAILFAAIAMFAAALLVLVLFLSAFLPVDVQIVVSVLFVASLGSLIASLVYFIVDIFGSLRAMDAELGGSRG
jgi:hypothetical protein